MYCREDMSELEEKGWYSQDCECPTHVTREDLLMRTGILGRMYWGKGKEWRP